MLGIEENDVIPDSREYTPQSGFGDVGDDYDLAVDSVTGRGRRSSCTSSRCNLRCTGE